MEVIIALIFASGISLIGSYFYRKTRTDANAEASKQIEELFDLEALGDMPEPVSGETEKIKHDRKQQLIDSLAGSLSRSQTLNTEDGRSFLSALDHKLILAGKRAKYSPEQYLAFTLSMWSLGIFLALFLILTVSITKILPVAIVLYFLAYPVLRLRADINNRQSEIAVEVPDFINELYMSMTAGTTIDQAIVRCAQNAATDRPDAILPREFAQAQVEYTVGGKTKEEALRGISYRTGVDSVSNLVEALIQGDKTGSKVTDTLSAYSDQAQEMWNQAMRLFKNKKEPAITIGVVITMGGAAGIYTTPLLVGMLESLGSL